MVVKAEPQPSDAAVGGMEHADDRQAGQVDQGDRPSRAGGHGMMAVGSHHQVGDSIVAN
jgi:hypothetical protein